MDWVQYVCVLGSATVAVGLPVLVMLLPEVVLHWRTGKDGK